jgi:preprotein translocase subunit SecD
MLLPLFKGMSAACRPQPFTRNLALAASLMLLAFGLVSHTHAEGIEYLVEIQTNNLATGAEVANAQTLFVDALQKRLNRLGITGSVEPADRSRLRVRVFGLLPQDKENVRRSITKTAFMEFRLVHPESDDLVARNLAAPGYELLKHEVAGRNGARTVETLWVKRHAERGLNGTYVKRAMVTRDSFGNLEIDFELSETGAKLFAEVTRDNIGRRLAIVLDGQLYSAPVIRGEIPEGAGQITGLFDIREAFEFANLMENPFPAPLSIIGENPIDPSIESAHLRNARLRVVLLAGGALAMVGVVIGAVVYIIIRASRRKPCTDTPPVLGSAPPSNPKS